MRCWSSDPKPVTQIKSQSINLDLIWTVYRGIDGSCSLQPLDASHAAPPRLHNGGLVGAPRRGNPTLQSSTDQRYAKTRTRQTCGSTTYRRWRWEEGRPWRTSVWRWFGVSDEQFWPTWWVIVSLGERHTTMGRGQHVGVHLTGGRGAKLLAHGERQIRGSSSLYWAIPDATVTLPRHPTTPEIL